MTKLHQDEVTRFEFGENFFPSPFGEKGAAAAATNGAIDHCNFRAIEL